MNRKLFYLMRYFRISSKKRRKEKEELEIIIKYRLSGAFGNKFPMLFLLQ